MNLSDETSRDSSVMIGQEYEENILYAGHNDVDLSVSSNGEFGQNQDRGTTCPIEFTGVLEEFATRWR